MITVKRAGLAAVLAVVLSVACFCAPAFAQWSEDVLEVAAANRIWYDYVTDEKVMKQFASLLYPYASLAAEPALSIPDPPRQSKAVLLKDEALEDVEFFFALLKYGYAGYQYFGGDERFVAAKELIVREVEEDLPRRFTTGVFENTLYKHLSFINDGHFYVGNRRYLKRQAMYMNFEYNLSRDDSGFYLDNDGDKEYIEAINGQEPEQYMRFSLNESGEIVYRIGMLEPEGEALLRADVTLVADGSRRELTLGLEKVSSLVPEGSVYEYYRVDGIPVVSLRGSSFDSPAMEKFVADAQEVRQEEAVIIDLRGNSGGDAAQMARWLGVFTDGATLVSPFTGAQLSTKTVRELIFKSWPVLYRVPVEILEEHVVTSETGWSEITLGPIPERVPNDVAVVVLMDSRTVSAGEVFVEILASLDNVVLLGTNTGGRSLAGNPVETALPNSQLRLGFGTGLQLRRDFVDREGIGLFPDFWVQPEDAVKLAVKFIENYGSR